MKLLSDVSYLEQLAECLKIQLSAIKSMHPIISGEVHATIGRVSERIGRVPENSAESLVVHLTNLSCNFRRGAVLKYS
jgi:hypothetical protein